MIRYRRMLTGALLACGLLVADATAQPLGTFRWQLQPYCNVVTVAVTQNGAIYRLEGTDDQCGNGADAASVTGTAFPNPDGTIGFGLNIVTAPGGRPQHVDAEIALSTLSGTWRDSSGATGTFALTPGAGTGGSARPLPAASPIPALFALRDDGGFVAGGTGGVGAIPASGPGVRMMWYPRKAAFRVGESIGNGWDDSNIGVASAAIGLGTSARGDASTATGMDTTASGPVSTALGNATRATAFASTAMGDNTNATASGSTAMGSGAEAFGTNSLATGSSTRASGSASTAMGTSTTASGTNSLAVGSSTLASGSAGTATGSGTTASGANALAGGSGSVASGSHALAFGFSSRAIGSAGVALGTRAVASGVGSFVFGDSNNLDVSAGTNEFKVRASGGVFFYSNASLTVGVALAPNGNQWLTLSDVRTKHRFRELDGDDILARIAHMPVTEWSYKAQDDAIRHIGPTAQDFHAAFGLGEDPLRIGTLDADGVALAAVKALEARTRSLAEHNSRLERENQDLRDRLIRLESLLEKR